MYDGWGCMCGINSSAPQFKTKGSWEFARRTLRYNVPVVDCFPIISALGNLNPPVPRSGSAVSIQRIFRQWAVRHPIPSLQVLSANKATHLKEEDAMKFAPLHVDLIRNTGINTQKQNKWKGEKPPPLIHAQKKAKGNV